MALGTEKTIRPMLSTTTTGTLSFCQNPVWAMMWFQVVIISRGLSNRA